VKQAQSQPAISHGSFLHVGRFRFPDGTVKDKYCIVLEDPMPSLVAVVVVVTTSQSRHGLGSAKILVPSHELPGLQEGTIIDCDNLQLLPMGKLRSPDVTVLGRASARVMAQIADKLAEATLAPEELVLRAVIAFQRR
jgi:hypothetical protein